jgi:integrase
MLDLTELAIRNAKPREKPYKLKDGGGLFLLVNPDGARYWRFRYQYQGREKLTGLGVYPDVTLKLARERRDEARKLIVSGVDPVARRRIEKMAQADSFQAIAEEWISTRKDVDPGTIQRDYDRLRKFIYPYLGKRPIAAIEAPELLQALRRIEARGTHETAHRTRSVCGRVFRYAIATGRASRDVSADLKGALTPAPTQNLAAITEPRRVGELLRAIDGYQGHPYTALALRLLPLVFTRPGEIRAARWTEIDLGSAEWRIPAERMKKRREHIVPLSRQALAILSELQPLTSGGPFLFPSLLAPRERPMSNNTLNTALRRMGYSKEEMTSHGFRSVASTLLNEQGFSPDVIELQLAHKDRNQVRAVYNRSLRLPERRKMMQDWADYLDRLRAGAGGELSLSRAA